MVGGCRGGWNWPPPVWFTHSQCISQQTCRIPEFEKCPSKYETQNWRKIMSLLKNFKTFIKVNLNMKNLEDKKQPFFEDDRNCLQPWKFKKWMKMTKKLCPDGLN